jgi:hypothetical protein
MHADPSGYDLAVSELPQGIDPARDRDLEGRRHQPWTRRVVLVVLGGFCAAALAGLVGQRPATTSAGSPAADLTVTAPERLRGGLFFEGTIRVRAVTRVPRPRLVLGPAWVEGVTTNSISPEAADQDDDDGRLVLAFGELPAGETLTVRIAMQMNPTTWGRMAQDVELRDGDEVLARVDRDLTVFP